MASLQFDEPAGTTRAIQLLPTSTGLSAAFGSLNNNPSHSPNIASGSPASIPNQRVAQISQAEQGHQTSPSSAYTNRFSSLSQSSRAHQQFYASVPQQNRPARPPVPLFTQGQQTQSTMDLRDAMGFDDFPLFQGGATTAYSSPGVPSYDTTVSSGASSAGGAGTISPHDVWIESAPNSAAITHLTSPSLFDGSPDQCDFEISPNFGNNDVDRIYGDWPSLFPEETATQPTAAAPDQSPSQKSDDLEDSEPTSKPRRKSGNSPAQGKHSSVAGVNARRPNKPLPPIVVDDPNDVAAMKRARNTLAARKSRERKAQRLEELEERIAELEQERDHWRDRAEKAEAVTTYIG
ncbi:hypothetical protein F5Y04DRAFT_276036 [Hypomontagnella monticulosa]|nr:hypothetical protein F5Y04DRAFT_276036 [Hypomontagnella monticulosa]